MSFEVQDAKPSDLEAAAKGVHNPKAGGLFAATFEVA